MAYKENYNPTSEKECRELCRELGIDPERFWGHVNDFACDCFYAGQQNVRKELAGGKCENHAPDQGESDPLKKHMGCP